MICIELNTLLGDPCQERSARAGAHAQGEPGWDAAELGPRGQFTTSWPFMPRSRWVRPPVLTSHEKSNVPFCAGVNLISALLPGCSFTYLIPFGASTSMSAPSISRSWEPRYCDANMWVARPVLTTFRVTALPAFNVTWGGLNAYSLSSICTTEAGSG